MSGQTMSWEPDWSKFSVFGFPRHCLDKRRRLEHLGLAEPWATAVRSNELEPAERQDRHAVSLPEARSSGTEVDRHRLQKV